MLGEAEQKSRAQKITEARGAKEGASEPNGARRANFFVNLDQLKLFFPCAGDKKELPVMIFNQTLTILV